jgi:hypothetical protein
VLAFSLVSGATAPLLVYRAEVIIMFKKKGIEEGPIVRIWAWG